MTTAKIDGNLELDDILPDQLDNLLLELERHGFKLKELCEWNDSGEVESFLFESGVHGILEIIAECSPGEEAIMSGAWEDSCPGEPPTIEDYHAYIFTKITSNVKKAHDLTLELYKSKGVDKRRRIKAKIDNLLYIDVTEYVTQKWLESSHDELLDYAFGV